MSSVQCASKTSSNSNNSSCCRLSLSLKCFCKFSLETTSCAVLFEAMFRLFDVMHLSEITDLINAAENLRVDGVERDLWRRHTDSHHHADHRQEDPWIRGVRRVAPVVLLRIAPDSCRCWNVGDNQRLLRRWTQWLIASLGRNVAVKPVWDRNAAVVFG